MSYIREIRNNEHSIVSKLSVIKTTVEMELAVLDTTRSDHREGLELILLCANEALDLLNKNWDLILKLDPIP